MDLNEIQKILIILGIIIILTGIFLPFIFKLDFPGKLPGDLTFKGENYKVYIPLATCILASLIISILFNIFFKK